jgi:flagellar hook-length control protein FliK
MAANTQVTNGSQKTAESGNGGFNSILSGLMGQASATTTGAMESGTLKSQLLAMIESNGVSTNLLGLGKNLLSLAAALLNGSQSSGDQKALIGMLVSAFNQLTKSGENEPADLLKMLKTAQDPEQGKSLIDSLRSALESLPEDLKAKLKTDGNIDASMFSSEEIAAIQAALAPVFASVSDTGAVKIAQSDSSIPGNSKVNVTVNMSLAQANPTMVVAPNVTAVSGQPSEMTGVSKEQSGNEKSTMVSDKNAGSVADSGNAVQDITKAQEAIAGTTDKQSSESTKQAISGLNADQDGVLKRMSLNGKSDKTIQDTLAKEANIAGAGESDKAVAKSNNAENGDKNSGMQKESESGESLRRSLMENARATVSSSGNTSSQQPQTHPATSVPVMTPTASTVVTSEMKQVGITAQPFSGTELGFMDTDNFAANLMGKLDIMITESKTEAKIRLKPESLGELKIHLMMDGGSMKAVLNAANPQAKELIEANLSALKQSLEGSGIQVKEFEVSVNQQNDHDNQGYTHNRQRNSNRSFANLGSIEPSALNQPLIARNYLTSNGSMAVNYLA